MMLCVQVVVIKYKARNVMHPFVCCYPHVPTAIRGICIVLYCIVTHIQRMLFTQELDQSNTASLNWSCYWINVFRISTTNQALDVVWILDFCSIISSLTWE